MTKHKVSAVVVYQDDGEGFNKWLLEEFGILRKNDDFIDNVLLYHMNSKDFTPAKSIDTSNYSSSNPVDINKVVASGVDTVIVSSVRLDYEHTVELIDLARELGFTLYVVHPVRYYVPQGHINWSLGSSSHVDDRYYDEILPVVTHNKPNKVGGRVSVVALPATVYTYTHNGKSPNMLIMRDGITVSQFILPKIVNDFQTTPLQSELQSILNKGYLLSGETLVVQHADILPVDEDMLYDWLEFGGNIQISFITSDSHLTTYAPSNFVIKSLWRNVKVF